MKLSEKIFEISWMNADLFEPLQAAGKEVAQLEAELDLVYQTLAGKYPDSGYAKLLNERNENKRLAAERDALIEERQGFLEYLNEEVGTEHLPEEWQLEGGE